MIRWIAVILAVFLAGQVAAQTVEVRSGEHDGFTRLTLNLPKRMPWQVSQDEAEARLSFENSGWSFDIGTVFSRIRRDRLTGLNAAAGSGVLELSLGCACDLVPFWHGERLLVVDIKDSADAASPPSHPVVSMVPPSLPSQQVPLAAALVLGELDAHLPAPASQDHEADAATDKAEAFSANIGVSRDLLFRQMGRAMTQGLLSASPIPSKPDQNTKRGTAVPSPEQETNVAAVSSGETGLGSPANINLSAQSSIDRDYLNGTGDPAGLPVGRACLSENYVDVGNWGSDTPFARQVGQYRAHLSGEFDKIDPAVAVALARLYVYFGFGPEAQRVLTLAGRDTPEIEALQAMAEILGTDRGTRPSALSGQMHCTSPVAMWSVLSDPEFPKGARVDQNAVLRGFSGLPAHLQAYLGPMLSRRLLEGGDRETADAVLRIVARDTERTNPVSGLVSAEVELANGRHDQADATLEEVVASHSEASAEALVKLIDIRIAREEGISYATAQLAGAYAQEYRAKPFGRDLARVHILALAASGAFDRAYEELAQRQDVLSEEGTRVRSDLTGLLAAHADDLTFLRHTFAGRAGAPHELEPEVANAMASRLIDTGFASAARRFISPPAQGDVLRARKLLRAEIALDDRRHHEAEAELLGLKGKDADQLRARARSLAGEHAAAQQLYAASGLEEAAAQEAWLAGDWQQIGMQGDPDLASVAAMRAASEVAAEPMESEPDTALARNRKLVEDSGAARAAVEDLLRAKPSVETE